MTTKIEQIKAQYKTKLEQAKYEDKAFKKVSSILKGIGYKKFLDFTDTEEGKSFLKKVNTILKEKLNSIKDAKTELGSAEEQPSEG